MLDRRHDVCLLIPLMGANTNGTEKQKIMQEFDTPKNLSATKKKQKQVSHFLIFV